MLVLLATYRDTEMNTAIAAIIADLNEVLKDLDAAQVIKSKEWAKARGAAIKEFKASNKFRDETGRITNQHGYYGALFEVAGGKTWYGVFNGRNAAMIDEFMEKNCQAIVEKRNVNIAKKLAKEEVTAVTGTEYVRTSDGFRGTFEVQTNKGLKTVTIETIYAGGYNIQCFHHRTLVKVR